MEEEGRFGHTIRFSARGRKEPRKSMCMSSPAPSSNDCA